MKVSIVVDAYGGHVHMRVFVNGALSGNLTVRTEEFDDFRRTLGERATWKLSDEKNRLASKRQIGVLLDVADSVVETLEKP